MRGGLIVNLYELWKFCVHFVEGKKKAIVKSDLSVNIYIYIYKHSLH